MISKIPLPTDNLYKFIALFGLMIFLTTLVMFFTRHQFYNESAFNRYSKIIALEMIEKRTEQEEKKLFILTEQQQIEESDEKLEIGTYVALAIFSFFVVIPSGFTLWYVKVQREEDRLLVFRVKKARLENISIIKNLNTTKQKS